MEFGDKALIDKYLHGELTDSEQEYLEERFFLEDDLFEQIETYEMLLIDRFVRGEMNAEQKARFETGYQTSPERQKKIAKANLFHKELKKLKGERKGWLSGLSSLLEIRMPVLQFAGVAAIVVFGLGLVWTVLILRSSPQDVAGVDVNGIEPPVNTESQNPPPVSPESGNRDIQGTQDNKKTSGPVPSGSPTPQLTIPKLRIQPGRGPIVTDKLEGIVSVTLEPRRTSEGAPVSVPARINQKTVFLILNLPIPAETKGNSFLVVVTDKSGLPVSASDSVRTRGTKGGRFLSVNLRTVKLNDGIHDVSVTAKDVASESVRYRIEVKRVD